MARTRTESRLRELVEAGAEEFIASQGYRRTQMEDIAKRAGVSKGTVYLYAESKAALFDLAVRYADRPDSLPEVSACPIRTPAPGTTSEYVQARLSSDPDLAEFVTTLSGPGDNGEGRRLEAVVRGLYRVLSRNRKAIKLIDVCAADHPELADLWYAIGRGGVTSLLEPYIEQQVARGAFVAIPNVSLAARFMLESCMVWAVHIHWDPHPEALPEEGVEDTLVHFIRRALLPIRDDETVTRFPTQENQNE